MAKAAIVVLADTETSGELGRVVNALTTVKEFRGSGDDVTLVFDGAGTKWIPELSKADHKYHQLFDSVRDRSMGHANTAQTPTASARRSSPTE